MADDQRLYEQTVAQYNDPDFATPYAAGIADLVNEKLLIEFTEHIAPGASILDVGCGTGRDSGILQSRGFELTAIDLAEPLLEIGRQTFPEIPFVKGDFTDMSFADGIFDAIWCHAALVHLPSQAVVKRALHEFWRVLKPGGIILIRTKARLDGEPETTVRIDKRSARQRYFRFQAEAEFNQMLVSAGFQILDSYVEHERTLGKIIARDEHWLTVIAQKPTDS